MSYSCFILGGSSYMADTINIRQIVEAAANSGFSQAMSTSDMMSHYQDMTTAQLDGIVEYVRSIDQSLEMIASGRIVNSQISARSNVNDRMYNYYGDRYNDRSRYRSTRTNGSSSRLFDDWDEGFRTSRQGFLEAFDDALFDGFIGSDFKKEIKDIFNDFANELGVSVKDIPKKLGKELGQNVLKGFKDTDQGKRLFGTIGNVKGAVTNTLKTKGKSFIEALRVGDETGGLGEGLGKAVGQALGGDMGGLTSLFQQASTSLSGFMTEAGLAGEGMAGIASVAGSAIPPILIVTAALWALDKITDQLKLSFEGVVDLVKALSKAANRDITSRQKNIELANKRLQADVEEMVTRPFKILEEAANAWYQTWDNNLQKINATQGYTKSDLQDLMSSFSQRLQAEGLTAYISGADISTNLAKVLDSGLSGPIAEEFAYQATKLNAAVPTQDFFSFASSYASVAANAIKDGKSQSEAIAEANASLTNFTSGLLYASRELSGGFTTGLRDASSIYEQAVKIAQTGGVGNIQDISSVLLAVRGEVGAVAPDLASSITDTIYKMLTGGNSSDTVALRSLAGINASNTEFLKAVAQNPKKVFSTLFENLAQMYNYSSDAFMEKAEGYSELFGISSEAFARIDFNELAQAISSMNMSDASLNENMKLLVEGQTTTSAAQLRNQQINNYMMEEGLALVLDNEAARVVQQHMWDEQMQREMMEATYAVDLQGESMQAINKILTGVQNILNFLNPLAWMKKVGNIVATEIEGAAQQADIAKMLDLGKVGEGNAKSFYQLTTRGVDLNVTQDLVTLMGGRSMYGAVSQGTKLLNSLANPIFGKLSGTAQLAGYLGGLLSQGVPTSGPTSQYSWGSVNKSTARASANLLKSISGNELESAVSHSGTGLASSSASAVKAVIDKMLSENYLMDKFVKLGKTFQDWAASAAEFGIADLNKALEESGYDPTEVESYFQTKETEQGVEELYNIQLQEKEFRDKGIAFWGEYFPNEYKDPLFDHITTTNNMLRDMLEVQTDFSNYYKSEWINKGWAKFVSVEGDSGLFNKFYSEFMKYFVSHYYYSNTEGYKYSDVENIQKKAKAKENGDTVYALAEMLTKNIVDLQDPQMQTNALLAQILIVVNAIQAQQNEVAGTSGQSDLLNSLSAMALGMTTTNSEKTATSTKSTKKK